MRGTPETEFAEGRRPPAGAQASRSAAGRVKPSILIADDEEAVLATLGEYLRCCGYDVTTARRPSEATDLLSSTDFAVVITDLRFFGVGGTQGLAIARAARDRNPSGRVFLLTAYRTPEAEAEIEKVGVEEVLEKPFPLWALAWRIMQGAPVTE